MALMKKISDDLLSMANIEQPPKLLGRAISMTLTPLPAGKRKRRFAKVDILPEDVFDEEDDEQEVIQESETSDVAS
jgi:translation initiation factor IF-3